MPTFIVQGRYSREAIQGMIAKPEDRTAAVAKAFESVGGKLLSYYVTFGPTDFLVIAEMPSEADMAAVAVAVASTGAVAGLQTTLAMTAAQAKDAFARAQTVTAAYRPAGKA
ncbi:GYD domain-containing protein [Elioraea sp.]|uniref:GYD domain-containing protein n=1 Tax=Elioraea sp. TaxID=2185103 RepID=UPI003F71FE6C